MNQNPFSSHQTQEIIEYVHNKYADELEFLWPKFSKNAIWRNHCNRKWYALLATVSKSKLGLGSEEEVEILVIRFNKNEALDFAASNDGIYPGYHMNKNNWISIILDGSIETERILSLLSLSYDISLQK